MGSVRNSAREDGFFEHIFKMTGQSEEREIKRVLRCVVSNGFIVKKGKYYSLPTFDNMYHMDADDEGIEDDDDDDAAPATHPGSDLGLDFLYEDQGQARAMTFMTF